MRVRNTWNHKTPNWLKLHIAWRAEGNAGLSLPYICAATGMQPQGLVRKLKEHRWHIGLCYMIGAPILGAERGKGFTISRSVKRFLAAWFGYKRTMIKQYKPGTYLSFRSSSAFSEDPEDKRFPKRGYDSLWEELLVQYIWGVLADGKESKTTHLRHSWERHYLAYRRFYECEVDFVRGVLGPKYPKRVVSITKDGRMQYEKR